MVGLRSADFRLALMEASAKETPEEQATAEDEARQIFSAASERYSKLRGTLPTTLRKLTDDYRRQLVSWFGFPQQQQQMQQLHVALRAASNAVAFEVGDAVEKSAPFRWRLGRPTGTKLWLTFGAEL